MAWNSAVGLPQACYAPITEHKRPTKLPMSLDQRPYNPEREALASSGGVPHLRTAAVFRRFGHRLIERVAARTLVALGANPETHARAILGQGGFDAVCRMLEESTEDGALRILRMFGAHVGERVVLHPGLTVVNADSGFDRLAIGGESHIGRQVMLDLAGDVACGQRVTLAMRCMILTHCNAGASRSIQSRARNRRSAVVIEDDAYVGAGAIVLPGVRIGARAIVGAGAIVTRNVAPDARVAGNPARQLRDR